MRSTSRRGDAASASRTRTPESHESAPRAVSFLPCLYYLPMTRVLLAEDDTSISEPLSRALRREGYEVDVTADGPSTLDKALGEGRSEERRVGKECRSRWGPYH